MPSTTTANSRNHRTADLHIAENILPEEPTLWAELGRTEAELLATVRSRRNRRELYHRMLSDALSMQALAPVTGPDPTLAEDQIREALTAFLATQLPKNVPIGIPQQLTVDPATLEGDDLSGPPFEILYIDLRGQAPARAYTALGNAGTRHSNSRNCLALATLYGTGASSGMLHQSIQRWISEYGRGEVFKSYPAGEGLLFALDNRRVGRYVEKGATQAMPLSKEIAALQQLITLTEGRRAPA